MKVIEKADIAPLMPLLCSVPAAMTLISRSERFIYDALSRGIIKGVKSDRRTLIVVDSLHAYVASLEPAKGCPIPHRRNVGDRRLRERIERSHSAQTRPQKASVSIT